MKRKIILTADGSKTIHLEDWNEQYHSKHGAIQEAYHVFIEMGLRRFRNTDISLLEIGFGTGLNAIITLIEAQKLNLHLDYVGIEAFPVEEEVVSELNYIEQLGAERYEKIFQRMHAMKWGDKEEIFKNFHFIKRQMHFESINDTDLFNLIYFDAFGPRVQPDLWTVAIFEKMYGSLKPGGILVTYSAKGSVRRAMQEVGFDVERLAGPPGKREMLRATKA
ncbi:tRNA (5-methylaminomethyl-2-thiouridine)(34)-methyltransferase MnmD [Flagellimonas allohymeniacidonis]|uniref:SAM-dependent methyltransferase n=1 Tax=Flagellimonas allohymeniacidonis TaxID=2517819 RepID=A0A4Q8QMB8_9FLAO|nr:tRNA (5-methylaminomethyl-2-thiouridine)(34)-methyltransferase MnmD [Allomuricauda hymeniacidonis]TAI49446.1 SAM-dependent methyltransferase [Allomuricauda hymeniacidonis]